MTRTPEEALRAAVAAIGGMQEVGHTLKPENDPIIAGQWLSHCLTEQQRSKLSLAQLVLIFRKANTAGEHDGFNLFARICGYGHAEPITRESEFAEAVKDAGAAAKSARAAEERLVELMARMRAAGLKVDE